MRGVAARRGVGHGRMRRGERTIREGQRNSIGGVSVGVAVPSPNRQKEASRGSCTGVMMVAIGLIVVVISPLHFHMQRRQRQRRPRRRQQRRGLRSTRNLFPAFFSFTALVVH